MTDLTFQLEFYMYKETYIDGKLRKFGKPIVNN